MSHRSVRLITIAGILAGLAAATAPNAIQAQGSGYKLPYPAGVAYTVTGTPATHTGNRTAYDFAMPEGSTVVAARAGTVIEVKQGWSACGGSSLSSQANYVRIRHNDNSVADYVHIKQNGALVTVNQTVAQGQAIARSGKVGYTNCGPHLHFIIAGRYGNLSFDDVGVPVLGKSAVSGNGSATHRFLGNASSRLFFDSNGNRINLTVCADNLPGQTVSAQLSRPGRTFAVVSQRASARCVTFWDMDGAGPTFVNTPYTTRAALNQNPNAGWPVPCNSATGGQGLCDTARR